MSQIVELIEQFDLQELFTESKLPGVRFFKSKYHIPRAPLVYNPGLCIVAQGRKIGYLGDKVFQYDANNYLVTPISTPFECESFATMEEPLIGIYIDIDMPLLQELVSQIGPVYSKNETGGIGAAKLDREMADTIVRFLKCLKSDTEINVLAKGLLKEIFYRALCGTQGPVLYSLANHDSSLAQIARALKLIHNDYDNKLDIEQLAKTASMSISNFHRVFKSITTDSPIQYLKKIRLNRARDFIVQERMPVANAAYKVGYESVSQFSREFKRYFGKNPSHFSKSHTS